MTGKTLTIWKYPVTYGHFSLGMPKGAQILTVQMQADTANIWALVDPTAPAVSRRFILYGTGHDVTDRPLKYIGTFQPMSNGELVFHLFEEVE